jgi:hypothetical protein
LQSTAEKVCQDQIDHEGTQNLGVDQQAPAADVLAEADEFGDGVGQQSGAEPAALVGPRVRPVGRGVPTSWE